MMYLKFGFGRATQDAGIEIRRGAMSREQAINLVKLYDNQYPFDFESLYLDYFEMTKSEFDEVLAKWVNKDLFEKKNGLWEPKFEIDKKFNYMTVVIVDYGMGNLLSLKSAILKISGNTKVVISHDKKNNKKFKCFISTWCWSF